MDALVGFDDLVVLNVGCSFQIADQYIYKYGKAYKLVQAVGSSYTAIHR